MSVATPTPCPWVGRPFVFRVNDNGGGPHLLLKVCVERGWREYNQEGGPCKESWNLWWRTSGFPMSHYKQLKAWQFTNHIPKGSMICRKDNLARYLRCMKQVYGPIYDFSPLGYNLPLEYTKLVAEYTRQQHNQETGVWICKPVSQSQGRGIFLFRKLSDLNYDTTAVVQRYIQNPLLIGGYKFDLRLYVCIPCYHPLTVYLYREGLVRFGTDKFSLADLDNPFRHLTNSSLNKLGRGYKEKKERVGAGCKWSLRQLRMYLQQAGLCDWLLWQRIASLVVLTVLSHSAAVPPSSNCFEFYGFDVLVDSSLRPWLLEVNLSPALGNDCDVDAAVKKPLLHDMFDLLGLPVCHTGLSLFAVFGVQPAAGGGSDGGSPASHRSDDDEEAAPDSRAPTPTNANRALAVVAAASRWKRRHQQVSGSQTRKKSAEAGGRRSRSAMATERTVATSTVLVGDCEDEGHTPGRMSPDTGHDAWSCYCYSQGFRGGRSAARPSGVDSSPPGAMWGNGRDWRRPPASEGGWVRLCPLLDRQQNHQRPPGPPSVGDREVRNTVSAVSRYIRTARDIYRRNQQQSDAEFSAAMRQTLSLSGEVWVPRR